MRQGPLPHPAPLQPGAVKSCPPTPQTATPGGPPRPGGTTKGIRSPPQKALTQPGRSPLNTLGDLRSGASRRPSSDMGLPTSVCGNSRCSSPWDSVLRMTSSTCGSGGSTTISRTGGGYGSRTSRWHTADQTPTCSKHPRADASRAATERQRPQHPTVQGPRVLGKQEGQGEAAMMVCYAQTVKPEADAESPMRDTPSTVAMVGSESGHYYQMTITP